MMRAQQDDPSSGALGPLRWLHELGACLREAACRQGGKPVSLPAGLEALAQLWAKQRTRGGTVFWAGNGGSAAIASHLSQDLMNKCGVKSITFNDPALITCMANDYGYAEVFRRPLAALAQPGDALIAISSSGRSDNIVGAASSALDAGLEVITLSAFDANNPLHGLPGALSFHVPATRYGHAELAHGALLHAALDWLEGGARDAAG